jgi:hypothetical protein
VDSAKDLTVDNSNYHLFWINSGVAAYDNNTGAGVGICPIESPLVSLGIPGEYQFDKFYQPDNGHIFINLYNNHWRTNFAAWIGNGERMSSRVRIWSFDRYNTEETLYSPAMEARIPLKVSRSRSNPGQLPATQAGVSLSRKGIALTAFGPNPDGKGTILRLWEQSGKGGPVEIILPSGNNFTKATPVTLRGEKTGESKPILDRRIRIELNAYSPVSLILE